MNILKGNFVLRVPSQQPMRHLWFRAINRLDERTKSLWEPSPDIGIFLCSKHFNKTDYELLTNGGHRRLKREAIPSIFDSFPSYLQPVCIRKNWRHFIFKQFEPQMTLHIIK